MKLHSTAKFIFILTVAICGWLSMASMTSAQTLFPDVGGNMLPGNGALNIPLDKGRRGLLYHFNCVDGGGNPVNGCFPLGHYDNLGKFVSLGSTLNSASVTMSAAANPCTFGAAPAPGACSFVVLDAFGHGSVCDSPIPNDPNPHNYPCADTIEIFYNGTLPPSAPPSTTVIQETVSAAVGHVFDAPPPVQSAGVTQATCPGSPCTSSFTTASSGTSPAASIELVFDISGSMAWPAVPSGAITRMKTLKDSTATLFSTLNSFTTSGDKLGLTTFSTTATPDPGSCSGTNLIAADSTGISKIQGQVSLLGPTNSTSIGAGLLSANTCGFAADMAGNANKEILLFSDGEQNDKNQVGFSPSNHIQVSDVTGTSFSDYPASNNSTDIHICPVTAGRLTAAGFHLQQQIANATCNSLNAHIRDSDQTIASADLETFFAQSLSRILPTDKMEVVSDTTGTVARAATVIEKYLGNTNDVKTTIALSWSGVTFEGGEDSLILRLRSPDGSLVDLTGRTTFTANHSFTSIPFPLFRSGLPVGQKGTWQIELDGSKLFSQQVTYHLLVMSDNPTIATQLLLETQNVGTGEPAPIRVKLTDGGSPVLNAVVQAQLEGPQNSQGNFLSKTPATIVSNPGDPASTKGQAKLDALLTNAANAGLFADRSLPTLNLLDNGNSSNGDTTANDGVYSGLFKDTTNEGHYYFVVRILGTSAKAGDFQRSYFVATFVRSKPDASQTNLKVISYIPQANGTVVVTLGAAPQDSFGNFLGPGYEKDMQITSSIGSVQTPFNDNLNGSYQITYSLPSTISNPTIGVVILSHPVLSVPLHSLPGYPGINLAGGRFAVSFHIGGTAAPAGSLSGASPSVSVGGDFEYRLPHGVSFETYLGYDRVTVAGSGFHFVNLSERLRYTYSTGRLRPFAFFGSGGYFATGSNNYGGINVGGGLQYWINQHFAAEGTYTFHNVFASTNNAKYSAATLGVRYGFLAVAE